MWRTIRVAVSDLGERGYLRAFGLLLLVVAAFPFLVGYECYSTFDSCLSLPSHTDPALGCQGSVFSRFWNGSPPEINPGLIGEPLASLRGQRVHRLLTLTPGTLLPPAYATVWWYPDEVISKNPGANITFDPLPTDPQGPPPYKFDTIVERSGSPPVVDVSYVVPMDHSDANTDAIIDTFTIESFVDSLIGVTLKDMPAPPGPRQPPSGDTAPAGAGDGRAETGAIAPRARDASSPAAYGWWRGELWVYVPDVSMTTAVCQDGVDRLQAGDTFLALRFPVLGSAGPDPRSYLLPVLFRKEPNSFPRADLVNFATNPSTTVVSLPLELRPERMSFAENTLPAAPGERWLTLAPAASPRPICPANLQVTSGLWELHAVLPLDFGGTPDACRECVLQAYACYEGTAPPFSAGPTAQAAAAVVIEGTVQGSNITCMGPMLLRLTDTSAPNVPNPPFTVTAAGSAKVSPPLQVSFRHYLQRYGSQPVTLTLSTTSSLGLSWRLYRDANGQPDFAAPITAPVTVDTNLTVWLVADIPAGVSGGETAVITATSASPPGSASSSDQLWVGKWTPPPTPTPTPTPHSVHRHLRRAG